jgi:glycosyltransferase involved in cell wall biosynthesis
MAAFASGIVARGLASLRLRREVADRHRRDPYDVIYQFSSIETPAVPRTLIRTVPLVIHPETHSAGELRSLIAERRLILRCQSRLKFAAVLTIMVVRSLVQRASIGRASLLVCISSVFRNHLVRDYRFPESATTVIANPVRLERFPPAAKALGSPPTVLVLGRIAVRKGVEDVVATAKALRDSGIEVRVRVVGGPSLWSDYTKLLEDLPRENAEYAGRVASSEVPAELAHADVLLQPSSYEPFALTVAEALAAGVPVIATSEVGAIEDVDRSVAAETPPGDVPAIVAAIVDTLDRLASDPEEVRAKAHAEAQRLFAPDVVCEQISTALERLVAGLADGSAAAGKAGRDHVPA